MENMILTLHWNDNASDSLRPMLKEANIEFEERDMLLKGGIYNASGSTVVEILNAASGLGLAGVLIAWIKAKSSRHIHVQKTDKTVEVITKGVPPEVAEKLLKSAMSITATEVPEKKRK